MTDETPRACIACPAVYAGPLACPDCGEPGEPMECVYCGGDELRFDPALDAVDCVGCGESP